MGQPDMHECPECGLHNGNVTECLTCANEEIARLGAQRDDWKEVAQNATRISEQTIAGRDGLQAKLAELIKISPVTKPEHITYEDSHMRDGDFSEVIEFADCEARDRAVSILRAHAATALIPSKPQLGEKKPTTGQMREALSRTKGDPLGLLSRAGEYTPVCHDCKQEFEVVAPLNVRCALCQCKMDNGAIEAVLEATGHLSLSALVTEFQGYEDREKERDEARGEARSWRTAAFQQCADRGIDPAKYYHGIGRTMHPWEENTKQAEEAIPRRIEAEDTEIRRTKERLEILEKLVVQAYKQWTPTQGPTDEWERLAKGIKEGLEV